MTYVYTILILKHVLFSWIIFIRPVLLLEFFTKPPDASYVNFIAHFTQNISPGK